jgi:hypothetical protein
MVSVEGEVKEVNKKRGIKKRQRRWRRRQRGKRRRRRGIWKKRRGEEEEEACYWDRGIERLQNSLTTRLVYCIVGQS